MSKRGAKMNKTEFVQAVVARLQENGDRKPVRTPGYVFHISDNNGNAKDFTVKQERRTEGYTASDVRKFIDAAVDVIKEALVHGDNVSLPGFGSFGLKWRKARSTKDLNTGEPVVIEPRYVPRFFFGKDLRICGKLYELSLKDNPPEEDILETNEDRTDGDA